MTKGGRIGLSIKRVALWLLWISGVVVLLGAAAGAIGYKVSIIDDESPHLERDYITAVIARESPVLYRDGQTRIGVFFSQEHRQYTPYAELPEDWVNAIVASEDKRFFSHPGVDIEGIVRALIQNSRAGRVVSGGSTLTQQTAKNLYYRPDRSLRSKWEELLNALRLEHRYSKSDILEFYANQFHVSANGRGIGIAARYFFDKPASELDLLESAFIAGMVKGPANYDPFIGRTTERQAAARERASARIRYVLERMHDREVLSDREHESALTELSARFSEERFFNRGQFRYDSHILLDEVEARLAEAPFPELFSGLGIGNPSTAGIQIVTTVDADVQRAASYALWHHLAEVGPVLESWTADQLVLPPETSPDILTSPPEIHGFYVASVSAVEGDAIQLDLGGSSCTVDADGIARIAGVLARARRGERWARAEAADIAAVSGALSVGDPVYASVREAGRCDLEIRPVLQGGVVILDQGRLRAMVGGNDNKNFNRAVTARRQLGSTWKPLIYAAALQLSWSPLDPLDNREGGFPFEGVWYYPRAAHEAPDTVSLSWSGTHSENLSSVWLLYHLTDRLSTQEFHQVAEQVGLTRQASESAQDYLIRIRDDYGVISTRSRTPELAWTAARLEVFGELAASDPAQALAVQGLLYAGDAERESARVARRYSGRNASRRLTAIRNNPHHLTPLAEQCAAGVERLQAVESAAVEMLEEVNRLSRPRLQLFGRPSIEDATELQEPIDDLPDLSELSLVYTMDGSPEDGVVLSCASAVPEGWRSLAISDLDVLGRAQRPLALEAVEDVVVEGDFTVGVLRHLARTAQRRELVMASQDPYSEEALQYHPDFRLLVGILYVSQLTQRLGVETDIPPVMSMPLGAADITLEEAALMYQGLLTGQSFRFSSAHQGGGPLPLPQQARDTQLIEKILDQDGNVLYWAQPEPVMVSDPVAGVMTAGVLRSAVQWGTGRRARGAVTVGDVPVPLFGKTGTTNSYRNAAFCGYVPSWDGAGWSWEDGYTIAVYVGYDDNTEMRRGSFRLAGSSGALPAWIGAAQGLADAGMLGEPVAGVPWAPGDNFEEIAVQEGSGLALGADQEGSGRSVWIWGQRSPWSEVFSPQRRFATISSEPVSSAALPAPVAVVPLSDAAEGDGLEDIWIPEMGP
jgi:membrane peptidoglycan carboxypeptidase